MADKKISALTGATTPLAGTEVLPIVQSGATVKVAVSDLTAGRAISATQLTSTIAIGTAPLVVTSTTNVANLNASSLNGATFAAPGAIGSSTASTGSFSTLTTSSSLGVAVSSPSLLFQVSTRGGMSSDGVFQWGESLTGNNRGFLTWDTNVGVVGAPSSLAFSVGGSNKQNISSAGIVTMSAYGAGAATFSAAGVISSVSDETWKTKDGVPTNTDAMLQKLEPGYWFYNEEKAPIFGQDRQLGFYAQNVHEAIGEEAAPTPEKYKDEEGNDTDVSKPWGYYDRSVLAVAVMSLKNALNTIEELKQRIETLENK
jgi:hypothetical protein